MYQKALRVGLFGAVSASAGLLQRTEVPEELSLDVHAHDSFPGKTHGHYDIALVTCDSPSAVKEACEAKLAGKLIALVDEVTVAALDEEALNSLHDVWVTSIPEPVMSFRLRTLMREQQTEFELSITTQYLDTVIDSIPELVWFKDVRGAHLRVNTAFCNLVGKSKQQVEGRGHYFIWDIAPEEYAQGEFICLESDEETMRAKSTLVFDEQVKTPRGMRQFKTYKSPFFDDEGQVVGTVGVAHDVTDLGNIATQMDILINSLPFAVIVEDTDETILNMNSKSEEYFNIQRSAVLGGNISEWRRKIFGDEIADQREIKEASEFTVCIAKDCKTLKFTAAPIVDVFGNVSGKLRIYRDITAERELEAQATLAARTDYLTGLYNRRYFYEYLYETRGNNSLTLISLDLNGFKEINDQFGHACGDAALVKMSQTLRETFPHGFVARWGGDEFVVALMGEHALDEVTHAVSDMLEKLRDFAANSGNDWTLSASIGIAQSSDPAHPIDDVIRLSDDALYRSKRAGGQPCIAEG